MNRLPTSRNVSFSSGNIGALECCLASRKGCSISLVSVHCLIGGLYIFRNDLTYLIMTLTKHTTCIALKTIGWTIVVTVTSRLVLLSWFVCIMSVIKLFSVPCVPIRGIIYLVSQDIAIFVTQVV